MTTGQQNIIIGDNACANGTLTSNLNTVIGDNAGLNLSTGANNTFIGAAAGGANTTATNNVAVGKGAGAYISTGAENTILGANAGDSLTTGSNNACIGYDSEPSGGTASNQFTLGNTSTDNLRCNDTSISSLSDQRDKTEIIDLPIGLDFINAVRPVKFKWASRDGKQGKDGRYEAGFIAQELQTVETSKSVDYLNLVQNDNPDKLEAAPNRLFPLLVKAIQELSAKVTALEAG